MTFQYPPLSSPIDGTAPPAVGDLVFWNGSSWSAGPAATIPGDYTDSAPLYGTSITTYQGALDALKTWSGLAALGTVPTGDVVIGAYPAKVYAMAPAGNQTFDPSAVAVRGLVWIEKTTTSTHKISLKAVASWAYQGGSANTAYDLPGSALNSATALHAWLCDIDPVGKTVTLLVGVSDFGGYATPSGTAGPAAAAGTADTALRSDAVIPIGFGSDARGDLAVRGASAYQRLAVGTVGQVLGTNGTDPAWTSNLIGKNLDATLVDPVSASTGDVTINASATPLADYYMAPAGDQTFDPTAATVSQRVTITKTTNSTHKITVKVGAGASVAGFTVFQNGTINTNFDLPNSATNSATTYHQWTLTIDVPNKFVYVSPAA